MWKFHRICGKNISLENNCTTAKRLIPTTTTYHGICFTNTPLVNDIVYEIQVDELCGLLCLGVTTNIPSDLTEIYMGINLKESWILCCNALYKNGQGIGPYSYSTNTLQVGDKLGIVKASDNTLHYYLNGIDQGIAFSNLPEVVYGVVELWGNCCQVSIVNQGCDSKKRNTEIKESATEAGAQVAIKTSYFSGRPAEWNVDAVCEFITSIPEVGPYAAKFRLEHIDGAALIELDKKDLKEFFEMPLGLAVKICSHLKKLEERK